MGLSDLRFLVGAAYVASLDGGVDLGRLREMRGPVPLMLADIEARHDRFLSAEFPYDEFPDGWIDF